MPYEASMGERFAGSWEIGTRRMALIKKTYMFLSLGVFAAITGAYVAATTPAIRNLFMGGGWISWIIVMVLLNAIPYIAIACRHNPVLGVGALLLDGFFSGIVLGPAIYVACLMSAGETLAGNLVFQAGILTLLVFLAVSSGVWISGKRFSAPKYLMLGIFVAIIGAVILNFFIVSGIIAIIISAAIGVFGVMILVYATSDIIHDESIDSPITGAVMLFAGLFNVFTAILHILMAFAGGDD